MSNPLDAESPRWTRYRAWVLLVVGLAVLGGFVHFSRHFLDDGSENEPAAPAVTASEADPELVRLGLTDANWSSVLPRGTSTPKGDRTRQSREASEWRGRETLKHLHNIPVAIVSPRAIDHGIDEPPTPAESAEPDDQNP